MTTVAIITVLSPMILIVLVAVAGVLAVWLTLFIARVIFWLTIGGLIGLTLWAGEARASTPTTDKLGIVFVACGNGSSTHSQQSGLCLRELSAFKEGIAKAFELSIRPDLVGGSEGWQCRKAHWSTNVGGYHYEGEK